MSEGQITARIEAAITASQAAHPAGDPARLTADKAHFYAVFTPKNVDVANGEGKTGNGKGAFCGYHGAYTSALGDVIFGIENYPIGCPTSQFPSWGSTGNDAYDDADAAVGVLSHEVTRRSPIPS